MDCGETKEYNYDNSKRKNCSTSCVHERKGINAYRIPTDDYHASEYVGEFFKCRAYMTGFTGSAGTAVITQNMAGMWTDARYFIQAERQMGENVTLFKNA